MGFLRSVGQDVFPFFVSLILLVVFIGVWPNIVPTETDNRNQTEKNKTGSKVSSVRNKV